MIATHRIPKVAVFLGLAWFLTVPAATAQKADIDRIVVRSSAPSAAPTSSTGTSVLPDEVEPNDTPEEAQELTGESPIVINGSAEVEDEGEVVFQDQDTGEIIDDIEDLYIITLEEPGIHVTLTGLTADCDIFVINEAIDETLGESFQIGVVDESIDDPDLPAGTYFIGVSIFDPDPIENSTTYQLTVTTAAATAVEDTDVPRSFDLSPNYPNPFNPETVIPYTLIEPSAVRLEVFDLRGRLVRTLVAGMQAPDAYTVVWDGQTDAGVEVPSGAYVYRLSVGEHAQSRTLVLVR